MLSTFLKGNHQLHCLPTGSGQVPQPIFYMNAYDPRTLLLSTLHFVFRRSWYYSPIGAWEWAKPNSAYLTKDKCWMHVTSPRVGDVAAKGGHVGIVTGYKTTTSAAEKKVVKNDWGFRKSPTPTFWRYTC